MSTATEHRHPEGLTLRHSRPGADELLGRVACISDLGRQRLEVGIAGWNFARGLLITYRYGMDVRDRPSDARLRAR